MSHQVIGLDSGIQSTDGQLVRFDMRTQAGEVLNIEMPTTNIGDYVAFLCGLGQFAGRKTAAITEQYDRYEGALIEASHISVAEGRTDDEVIFAFQVGVFAIGIALPKQGTGPLQQVVASLFPPPKKSN